MEEPKRGGKRQPPEGRRKAAESQTEPRGRALAERPAPRPRPRPVATSKPQAPPEQPMAGRSYAQKQAEAARRAKGIVPEPALEAQPGPAAAKANLDLDEEFDLEEELADEIYEEEGTEAAPPAAVGSRPSRPQRRALAERVDRDVAEHTAEEMTGMAALMERREAWKKMVEKKEAEGKSPYIVRWAKVSFFPLLYFGISLSLLRKITYEYSDYYPYDSSYILIGFVIGALLLVTFSVSAMLKAKRVKRPILLKGRPVWISVVVFIGASFYLAWFEGLAYAWLFSMGFLGAGLLIVLLGLLIEKGSKGTFWVKEPTDGSDKRWLEFVRTVEG